MIPLYPLNNVGTTRIVVSPLHFYNVACKRYTSRRVLTKSYLLVQKTQTMRKTRQVLNLFSGSFNNQYSNSKSVIMPDQCSVRRHCSIRPRRQGRRYMAEILPIRRKTLSNQSINQSETRSHPCA